MLFVATLLTDSVIAVKPVMDKGGQQMMQYNHKSFVFILVQVAGKNYKDDSKTKTNTPK